jgi:hypothetical protein
LANRNCASNPAILFWRAVRISHVWDYLGDKPGRILFAFSPAAKIEDFSIEASKPDARVDDARRFERHGMKVVGPPPLI